MHAVKPMNLIPSQGLGYNDAFMDNRKKEGRC